MCPSWLNHWTGGYVSWVTRAGSCDFIYTRSEERLTLPNTISIIVPEERVSLGDKTEKHILPKCLGLKLHPSSLSIKIFSFSLNLLALAKCGPWVSVWPCKPVMSYWPQLCTETTWEGRVFDKQMPGCTSPVLNMVSLGRTPMPLTYLHCELQNSKGKTALAYNENTQRTRSCPATS
jgi:hypothetical protein